MTEAGESMHLSMDRLRELVRKAEDKTWTESTEWDDERGDEQEERGDDEASDQSAPPEPVREPPLPELKPIDKMPPDHPPTPFNDPKDMPELPKGSDWVGKQERRRLEDGGILKEAKEAGEGTDDRHDRWRRPKKPSL